MNDFPVKVKEKLFSIIDEMSEHAWLYCSNPGHDFMRQNVGKLTFADILKILITMDKNQLSNELSHYFDMDVDSIPTTSAFIQRRHQILISAFDTLFSSFSESFPSITNKFKDRFCVLAMDGTHTVYSRNAEIIEDYNIPKLINRKGFNHMHLNAFVDCFSKSFLDFVIQPGQKPDERLAFHQMLDHFNPSAPENCIITVDRGYESYDIVFHCEMKHMKYVFRVKSPDSPRSILSSFIDDLPEDQDEYDIRIGRYYTDMSNKVMKMQPSVYHYMNPSKNIPHFHELLGTDHLYYLTFRVVKAKFSDDSYEYMITNLSYDDCTFDDIKDLYHLRWNIETSFRYLKHAVGLLHFHSKDPEFIRQEIYSRIILYNFGALVANAAADENQKKARNPDNKYLYGIDFSSALEEARDFLIRRSDRKPVDLIKLIVKFVHAIKTEPRHFARPMRGIGAVTFWYR